MHILVSYTMIADFESLSLLRKDATEVKRALKMKEKSKGLDVRFLPLLTPCSSVNLQCLSNHGRIL